MDIFGVLTMIGGLALFLYGMDVMGKALERQAGSKLHSILETLTASPLRGFLLGLAVTAVIQSSSASTVMVVGFVNSGIMNLSQASGIIMGSNVGTTVTAWILSLSGLQGDSLIIKLLKPSSFSPVLALIGIVMYMGRNTRRKDIGSILLGFAVLMFGMETMSSAVKPLANVPEFTQLFTMFSNPIVGLLAGALLTAVIQSSSASVGILQALTATGAITYGSAIPIIMGQNIGTCVTAILSAIGANRDARRAAMVHLYFNIIGAVVFLGLYTLTDSLFTLSFTGDAATGAGIALVHTAFNLFATALLLPFTKQLEKLAYLTIPAEKKADVIDVLDERLLDTPALAAAQSRKQTIAMARTARQAVLTAMKLCTEYTTEGNDSVIAQETQTDHYEDELGTYLVHLSSHKMTDADSREVSMLLHMIGDFERLGDHALNLSEAAREIHDKHIAFSADAQLELGVLERAIHEILDLTINALDADDLEQAKWVEPLEQVIDKLTMDIRNRHIERLQSGVCTIEMGFVLSDLLTNCERAADHCSNIAIAQIEASENLYGAHEYTEQVEASEAYKKRCLEYSQRYSLTPQTDNP